VRDLSSGFISVKVSQTCMDSLKSGPVSLSETCLRSSVDGSEAVGIKVVETTGMNKEEHPEAITFPTVKTEPEVSGVSV